MVNPFTISKTLKTYHWKDANSDFIAAIIVTLMLVPQSLAYALVAGLPAEIGLYSSILPLVMYALFGTSGSLAVGPVAVISLMTGATILSVDSALGYSSIEIAIALAFLSGTLLIIFSLLKLGMIVHFMSRSVIDGFIMASAILIIINQSKHILGIEIHGANLLEVMPSLYSNIKDYHMPTLLFGISIITMIVLTKYILSKTSVISQYSRKILIKITPALLVVLSILCIKNNLINSADISTVGTIPNGLPTFQLVKLDFELFKLLFVPALLISIIGYVESISVAIEFASKTKNKISPDKELFALGTANIGSSLSGGMPVTGGFSRSVVNYEAGSKTPLSGLYAAILISVLMMMLMGSLEDLPKATLAATIIVAVASLIDFQKLKQSWYFSKHDFYLTITTILTTLFVGVEIGVSVGIIFSILLHLIQTSKPHIAVVGQVPGTEHFRNVLRHDVETVPEIIGIRIDENICFANANYLETEILKLVKSSDKIQYCILQFTSVSNLDTSALECLIDLYEKLQTIGIELHLSEVKGPIMDKLETTELFDSIKEHLHLTHFQAVNKIKSCL